MTTVAMGWAVRRPNQQLCYAAQDMSPLVGEYKLSPGPDLCSLVCKDAGVGSGPGRWVLLIYPYPIQLAHGSYLRKKLCAAFCLSMQTYLIQCKLDLNKRFSLWGLLSIGSASPDSTGQISEQSGLLEFSLLRVGVWTRDIPRSFSVWIIWCSHDINICRTSTVAYLQPPPGALAR